MEAENLPPVFEHGSVRPSENISVPETSSHEVDPESVRFSFDDDHESNLASENGLPPYVRQRSKSYYSTKSIGDFQKSHVGNHIYSARDVTINGVAHTLKEEEVFDAQKSLRSFTNSKEYLVFLENTYSLMMMANSMVSLEWLLGLGVWIFQVAILIMLVGDLFNDLHNMNFPIRVENRVFVVQIMTAIIAVFPSQAITIPIRNIILMRPHNNPTWKESIRASISGDRRFTASWTVLILVPNLLQLLLSLATLFASLSVIMMNDTATDVLEGFAGVFVVSNFDDLLFKAAMNGLLTSRLSREALHVTRAMIQIPSTVLKHESRKVEITKQYAVYIPLMVNMLLLVALFITQEIGVLTKRKYPSCFLDENYRKKDGFETRKLKDSTCNVKYNIFDCGFDGGDCEDYNHQFPDCDADDPQLVYNDKCDSEVNTWSCGFDNGKCDYQNRKRIEWVKDFRCPLDKQDECDSNNNLLTSVAEFMYCNCTGIRKINEASYPVAVIGLTPLPHTMKRSVIEKIFVENPDKYKKYNETSINILNGSLSVIPFALGYSSQNKALIIGNPNENKKRGVVDFFLGAKSSGPFEGENEGDRFGTSAVASEDGFRIAVGAPGDHGERSSGYVKIYDYNEGGEYEENKTFTETLTGDFGYGHSIAISSNGTILVVGAPFEGRGRVHIYDLTKDYPEISRFDGNSKDDFFGGSVSMSSEGEPMTVAVGAHAVGEDGVTYSDNGGEYVKVYKFLKNESEGRKEFTHFGKTITVSRVGSFGFSVSLSNNGKWLAVGAPRDDSAGSNAGKTFVYQIGNRRISLVGDIPGKKKNDWSGFWVAFNHDGTKLAVASPKPTEGNETVRIPSYHIIDVST